MDVETNSECCTVLNRIVIVQECDHRQRRDRRNEVK